MIISQFEDAFVKITVSNFPRKKAYLVVKDGNRLSSVRDSILRFYDLCDELNGKKEKK